MPPRGASVLSVPVGLGLAIAAASFGFAARVRAEAPLSLVSPEAVSPQPVSRQVVFEGQMGVHAPLGQFGFAVDADVVPWLSLSAGAGMDTQMTADNYLEISPRVAFMPRVRLTRERWPRTAVSGGVGVFYGERNDQVGPASRVTGELSLEHRSLGGLRVRLLGGIGVLLGTPAPPSGAGHAALLPYGGLALGYALVPNPTVPAESSRSIGRWYGWQGLVLDASNALVLGLWFDNNDYNGRGTALRASGAIYFVTGPMVHLAHRNYGRAAASAAVRLSFPFIFREVGSGVMTGDSGANFADAGAVVGAVLAALCDDIFLAWERRDQQQ